MIQKFLILILTSELESLLKSCEKVLCEFSDFKYFLIKNFLIKR